MNSNFEKKILFISRGEKLERSQLVQKWKVFYDTEIKLNNKDLTDWDISTIKDDVLLDYLTFNPMPKCIIIYDDFPYYGKIFKIMENIIDINIKNKWCTHLLVLAHQNYVCRYYGFKDALPENEKIFVNVSCYNNYDIINNKIKEIIFADLDQTQMLPNIKNKEIPENITDNNSDQVDKKQLNDNLQSTQILNNEYQFTEDDLKCISKLKESIKSEDASYFRFKKYEKILTSIINLIKNESKINYKCQLNISLVYHCMNIKDARIISNYLESKNFICDINDDKMIIKW